MGPESHARQGFFSTPGRVERSMRHAIALGCKRSLPEQMIRLWPSPAASTCKPSNSRFIAAMADYLRRRPAQTAQPE